jgi:signal transduction histidine kinase
MRSLHARIQVGAWVLVAVLVSATLLLSRQVAVSEFNDFVQRGESLAARDAIANLQAHVDRRGTLDGVAVVLDEIHARTADTILLIAPDDQVIAAVPRAFTSVRVQRQGNQLQIDGEGDGLQAQLIVQGDLPTLRDAAGLPLAAVIVTGGGGGASPVDFGGQLTRPLLVVATVVALLGIMLAAVTAREVVRPIEQHNETLRRNLLNDVAHELRTPLTHIRGELEAILDGLRSPTREVIERLHGDALDLTRLVDDLRDVALAEAGQLRVSITPLDLADVIKHAVAAIRPAADERQITVETTLHGSCRVHADAARVRQILNNLLDNAVRHTPNGGTISVDAAEAGTAVTVSVTNDGEPVAEQHLAHLFDRFYRADASRDRRTGGAGLGLAIVRHLTTLQGGAADAANVRGRGLRVTVSLPALLITSS